ncbi:MAG: ADP-ribosylglycohydrolase family protein, partial [Gemmatimonadales bacterium]
ALPVALATLASPRNLVSGTWHVARLLHPEERCAWGAVAVNIALARFLLGHRDFVPDVIEALRMNEAPADLIEVVRQVPLRRREDLPVMREPAGHVLHTVEVALWFAWHEPKLERGLVWIANAGGDTDTNAAVAGALLGARDGEDAIPARWLAAVRDTDHLAGLAEGLLGISRGTG